MEVRFDFTHKIINLISSISQIEGEFRGLSRTPQHDFEVQSLANAESVHYSTKIEGNPLTLKEVTTSLKKKPKSQNRSLKEILNYSELRNELLLKIQRGGSKIMTLDLILRGHDVILNRIVIKSHRGKLRKAQNVVKDVVNNKIVYLPPEHVDVSNLLKNHLKWVCAELSKRELSSLIVSAVFHYMFVTIHPFMDGNGRLARIFSNYIIQCGGFEISKYASIEKFFEKNRKRYYQVLRQHQAYQYYLIPDPINLTLWIEYVLDCYEESFKEALERLRENNAVSIELNSRLEKGLALFQRYNKMRAAEYETIMGIGRTQTVADLNQLLNKDFIMRIGGGRSTVYILKKK